MGAANEAMKMDLANVQVVEWCSFGFAGAAALFSFFGMMYLLPNLYLQNFNSVWRARFILQVAALSLSISLLLPLEMLQYNKADLAPLSWVGRRALCRVAAVLSLGVFEPFFLFLAGFITSFGLRSPERNNRVFQPVIFALICSLPFSGVQVFSAWYDVWLGSVVGLGEENRHSFLPFAPYTVKRDCDDALIDAVEPAGAPAPGPDPSAALSPALSPADSLAVAPADINRCVSCTFTVIGTAAHLLLVIVIIVVICSVGRYLLRRSSNARIQASVRSLCMLVPLFLIQQCLAMAVTLVTEVTMGPETWPHEVAKAVATASTSLMVITLSAIIVVQPVRATAVALRRVAKHEQRGRLGRSSEAAALLSQPGADGDTASDLAAGTTGEGPQVQLEAEASREVGSAGEHSVVVPVGRMTGSL